MSNHNAVQTSLADAPAKRRRKVPGSQWAEIRTAYAAGIGLREMARKLGIPEGTVLAHAKRENWTRQIQHAKTLATHEPQSGVMTVMQSVARTMAERGQRHVAQMADVTDKVMPHVGAMEPGAILDRIEDIDRLDKVARRTYGIEDVSKHGGVNLTFNCLDVTMIKECPNETNAP